MVMLDTVKREREHGKGRKAESQNRKRKSVIREMSQSTDERIQWTLKGIDKETLEASRIAARKRGMKFGAWVNEVLRAATIGDSVSVGFGQKELLKKIAKIESKLDQSVGELKQQSD